ncbi:G-protein coupled receptor family C group 5 member C-like, partial [Megalops cyprinoides]|uniref:G-protein coupled receptor family C group 5 member C-like n=1 Tax=Megalops cyprinoides TaxID=118141 RepID=UPI0018642F57
GATNSTPYGCSPSISALYYNMCDLGAAWGVVVEAFAAAGVVASFVLLVTLLASLPFVTEEGRQSTVGPQAGLLACTLGLFGLAFAFIAGKDFSTCVARRFLFGVLFAGCFSCLLAHAAGLNVLARRDRSPRGWVLCLAALALWLVEVIINTEWLTITVARYPLNATGVPAACAIANPDFAMALVYVMVLLLAVLVAAAAALAGRHRRWHRVAIFILTTAVLSAGIWAAWLVMYVYVNQSRGSPAWDDPTLAVAVVANGWVFLALYVIPEISALTDEGEEPKVPVEGGYPSRGVGYETILKEQKEPSSQNVYVENQAFTLDETTAAANKSLSPYSGYNGQIRSCVYQPTELALITKGLGNVSNLHREVL